MKTAKKILWVCIALLPLLPIIFSLISHFGNNVAGENLPMGNVKLQPGDGGYYVQFDDNSWCSLMLSSFIKSDNTSTGVRESFVDTGLFGAVAGLCNCMQNYAGIPLSPPLLFGMWYLCYIAIVEILTLAIDFILFVPRKCTEIFR